MACPHVLRSLTTNEYKQ
uniref:Uncharacterized protein n=1 Tax=Arundo donax TaxID=35708 RepID=A0A0A8ZKV0_ARUDO